MTRGESLLIFAYTGHMLCPQFSELHKYIEEVIWVVQVKIRGKRKMQVLFRAKEKNSNNYVIGYEYYNHVEDEYYITHYASGSNYKVDRTTRSINIEDMIDSQGNKIFASLSEDGKGGDIMKDDEYYGIAKYINCEFVVEYENCYDNISEGNFEVVGVPEWIKYQ